MSTSVLTFARRSLILNSPNHMSRNRRLSVLPKSNEVLSAYSANFRVPSGIVSNGRRVSIGRPATSGTREGPAVSRRLGSVVRSAFFFFKSLQNVEVPYVQELYRSSSR